MESVHIFMKELNEFPWIIESLVFLDEVSFDNHEMYRKRGFGMKGRSVFFRGEYCRKPRVSLLCFLGSTGIIDAFSTEGTFDRKRVVDCMVRFATKNDYVFCYPGPHSVWIMDGASIHCNRDLVHLFRSLGVFVIYLPAYCPFFNPIELVFGLMKRKMRRNMVEGSSKPMETLVAETLMHFTPFDARTIFRKCGYTPMGFDPSKAFNINPREYGYQ
jgi:hypothetical protein